MAAPSVLPPSYKSQDISFSDWISLFTLALAPLIAHIVAGVPQTSYLTSTAQDRPSWHDRIGHYNPTSIIWRYGALADRRIRARRWGRADAAAGSALFWAGERGWDGSEAMVAAALPWCVRLPERARAGLVSRETAKTLVVTLQGVQALVPILRGLGTTRAADTFVHWVGLDNVFFPLAILGLLRLCCAAWLVDDFAYNAPHPHMIRPDSHAPSDSGVDGSKRSLDSLILVEEARAASDLSEGGGFRPTAFWASRVFRALYLLPPLVMLTTCVLYMGPWTKNPNDTYSTTFTTTSFLLVMLLMAFTSATIFICAYYFARGHTTTIVPCISLLWYKIYTVIIIGLGACLFVVACIETRKTPCGKYTSGPGIAADLDACSAEELRMIPLAPDRAEFGVASTRWNDLDGHRNDEFWVYNFTGTCFGVPSNDSATHVNVLDTREIETS